MSHQGAKSETGTYTTDGNMISTIKDGETSPGDLTEYCVNGDMFTAKVPSRRRHHDRLPRHPQVKQRKWARIPVRFAPRDAATPTARERTRAATDPAGEREMLISRAGVA